MGRPLGPWAPPGRRSLTPPPPPPPPPLPTPPSRLRWQDGTMTPEASWCSSAGTFSGGDMDSYASDGGEPPLSTVGDASTADTVTSGTFRVGHCLKVPEEGALVCLLTDQSAPLMATFNRRTKAWDLFPTVHKQDGSVLYLPNECLFIVVRQGERMGLRCVAADGRLVQATRHAADPLRAANYNFGKWETWEPVEGGGFRNRAWGRLLGIEIHEVRSCLASALYENELSHRRENNLLRDALEEAQEARQETEDTLERVVAESGVHITAARGEVARLEGELQQSLEEGSALTARLAEADADRTRLERALSRSAQEGQDLKACLEAARGESARLSAELTTTVEASAEKVRGLEQARLAEIRVMEGRHAEEVAELQFELEKREEALQVIASRASLFSTPRSSASTVTKHAFSEAVAQDGARDPAAKALDLGESPESQYVDAESDVHAPTLEGLAAEDKENVPPTAEMDKAHAFPAEPEDETAHLVQLPAMPDQMDLKEYYEAFGVSSSEEEGAFEEEAFEDEAFEEEAFEEEQPFTAAAEAEDGDSPGRRSVTELRAMFDGERREGSPLAGEPSARSPVAPSSHDLGLKTAEYYSGEEDVEARAAAKALALEGDGPAGLGNFSRTNTSMRMGSRIGALPPDVFA